LANACVPNPKSEPATAKPVSAKLDNKASLQTEAHSFLDDLNT
jgi:hypothetical protein